MGFEDRDTVRTYALVFCGENRQLWWVLKSETFFELILYYLL